MNVGPDLAECVLDVSQADIIRLFEVDFQCHGVASMVGLDKGCLVDLLSSLIDIWRFDNVSCCKPDLGKAEVGVGQEVHAAIGSRPSAFTCRAMAAVSGRQSGDQEGERRLSRLRTMLAVKPQMTLP